MIVSVLRLHFHDYFVKAFEIFGSLCRTSLSDGIRHLAIRLRTCIVLPFTVVSPSAMNSKQQFYSGLLSKIPWFLGGMPIFVCLLAFVISLGLAFLIVPRQVLPWTGLLLIYEWTFTIFFLLFGGYLRLIYHWGKANAIQAGLQSSDPESIDYDFGKGHQRQLSSYDVALLHYGLGVVFLAILKPSLPFLFGITALFVRLGLMVVACRRHYFSCFHGLCVGAPWNSILHERARRPRNAMDKALMIMYLC